MKKISIFIVSLSMVLALTSCRTSKEMATISNIDGEWNIIEINGSAVVPPVGHEYPFIGFEAVTGKVYGNSGCNRMMGTFDTSAKAGVLDLSHIASTRMFCPDMTLEQNVLNVLKNVKGYRMLDNNRVALTNSYNRPVVVLANKENLSVLSSLEGEWKITQVNGETIPANLDKKPYISFDTSKKSIHGNAGCNMINGGFTTSNNSETSIAFPAVAATMMACPDMTIERKIMNALNIVKSFSILTDKSAGLYGEDGTMLLLLMR
ncbi:META domain-containing protein [Bacteroides sp. 519]|uniref:META domain-containing protein n=1 Tax=Bacteroides sp. 519 TaxID=2302937 RepID=UPI0013D86858|nr:META domain-containing protein [Bacteroides sp. 519]NDV59069.1 META domain-containing protein [Bacteroides sp. 519]